MRHRDLDLWAAVGATFGVFFWSASILILPFGWWTLAAFSLQLVLTWTACGLWWNWTRE